MLPHLNFHSASCNLAIALVAVLIARENAVALAYVSGTGLLRYESLQPEYNLYTRAAYEQELEPLCLEHGLGVIPYSALASGFLTGKYRSENDFGKSPRGAGMTRYLDARGLGVLAALIRSRPN